MKKRSISRVMLSILVTICVLFVTVSTVSAFPPIPDSFFGPVQVNAADIPVGTQVSAWINGTMIAWSDSQPCTEAGITYSCYSLTVGGDDPATADLVEGGVPGDVIVFRIGNLVADQTRIWAGGANLQMPLTATDPNAPNIVVTGALEPFLARTGQPSIPQRYTVSGVNLTADIVISAPAHFQVSLEQASGYSSSVSIHPSGGTVDATSVYVRLLRSTNGSAAGEITHASPGAPTRILAVSGESWTMWLYFPLALGYSPR